MTREEMEREIRRLAPFHHKVDLPHGLKTYDPDSSLRHREQTRLDSLVRHAFPRLLEACGGSLEGKRVIDVACNAGGFSIEAARLGAEYVLGFDVADRYLDQANFIKRALGLEQVEFKKMALADCDESEIGTFDIAFCFGILYHLENPVYEMKKLASVTRDIMLIDANVYQAPFSRKSLWKMNVPRVVDDEDRTTTAAWRTEKRCQFKPNVRAVVELLDVLGFPHVEVLKPRVRGLEFRYYRRKRVTFLARR
ncbi:MAG: class I SAM-dependent methyltransferase [Woeseiaceae bacterium]|nr:class I SAM-dependent methyltransferase [Woeseiaceae bacterium]